jgi:hypothetical protein
MTTITEQEAIRVLRGAVEKMTSYCEDFCANAKLRGAEDAYPRAAEMAELGRVTLSTTTTIRPAAAPGPMLWYNPGKVVRDHLHDGAYMLTLAGTNVQWGEFTTPLYTAAPALAAPADTAAARDVLAERRRQIECEGWTPEHDDEHSDGSLARAAAAYAIASAVDGPERAVLDNFGTEGATHEIKRLWPQSWAISWFKPKSRRADLVKAGALILADIELIDRAALRTPADARQKGAAA